MVPLTICVYTINANVFQCSSNYDQMCSVYRIKSQKEQHETNDMSKWQKLHLSLTIFEKILDSTARTIGRAVTLRD